MLNNLVYNSQEKSNNKLKSKRILEMLFDFNFELHDFYQELEYYINLNRIKVNQNTLKNLKSDIDWIENDSREKILINWEYINCFPFCSYFTQELITDLNNNDFKLINQKIFEKYIDLFHSLENNPDLLQVSQDISKTVIEILNSKNKIKYFVINQSVIWVFQSLHWDLTLYRYKNNWNNQIDLFTNRQKNILQTSEIEQSINIYQYPENLVSKILEFCYKFNYIPKEINELLEINPKIPDATWSLDLDWFCINDFENSLEENIIFPKYLSMNPGMIYTIEIDIINEKINILQNKKIVFEINKQEMWTFLKLLVQFPWRSISTIKKLIQIYLNKVKS